MTERRGNVGDGGARSRALAALLAVRAQIDAQIAALQADALEIEAAAEKAEPPTFLDLKAAAFAVKKSPRTIKRWAAQQPSIGGPNGAGRWVVNLDELQKFMRPA